MLRVILLSALLTITAAACADESAYNRIDFNTEAHREIANDLLLAQMQVEVSDGSPARIAQKLNSTLNDALKKAGAFSSVKASSGNHNTFPIYGKNNHLDGWRGTAQIRLESRDFKAAGELIGQLQETMQLAGVSFTVAPETRRQIEDALVSEALAAFRQRAESIRVSMNGSAYKVVHISINQGGYYPHPMMEQGVMSARVAAAAPEFTGGDSSINMQISGTIEIIPNK